MTKTCLTALVAMLAAFVFVTSVNANEITFNGLAYNKAVQIRHEGTNLNVLAGAFLIKIDDNKVNDIAYCVDLDHWMASRWSATIVPVTRVGNGLAAAYLYDHFASKVSSDLSAAGLQVAIWETVEDYGQGLNLNSGNFRLNASNDVRDAAQGFLTALPSSLNGYTPSSYVILSGTGPQSQSLIVPEPGTVGLLTLSVLSLLFRNRF
jgi:hypothetical protein